MGMRVATLRSFALSLPAAEERETWDTATFRVRDKIFMMFSERERHAWNGLVTVQRCVILTNERREWWSRMGSEITNALAVVSFEETPLLEISVKAAAIEALGWSEYDRLPHRWIVKYEKTVAHADRPPADELENVMGDYWVDPSDIPVADLVTTEEAE